MHENSAVSEQPEQEGTPRIEMERAHFRTLILGNPNYFGNISNPNSMSVTRTLFQHP